MKIVLTPTPPAPTTYTGDPREWPDGLYKQKEPAAADYMILVWVGAFIRLSPNSVGFNTDPTGYKWTRIPGYTGGISSITPEREGE